MQNNYRFYSFVAGLYLSPIQCGIQTAHAVSEMSVTAPVHLMPIYNAWAADDKVLIVCQAINHAGVVGAYEQLQQFGDWFNLPTVLFKEDDQSMNGMATAAGIIVPECFYNARANRNDTGQVIQYEYVPTDLETSGVVIYAADSAEGAFIEFLKSYRLA